MKVSLNERNSLVFMQIIERLQKAKEHTICDMLFSQQLEC